MLGPLGARLQAHLHDALAHRRAIAEPGLVANGVVHGLRGQRGLHGIVDISLPQGAIDLLALLLNGEQVVIEALAHDFVALSETQAGFQSSRQAADTRAAAVAIGQGFQGRVEMVDGKADRMREFLVQ